jgi:hypothetical protein
MPITVSCPFCNAPVQIANLPSGSNRVSCPRCEEILPLNLTVFDDVADTTLPPAPVPPARALTNRAIARVVVAGMLGMAGLGLVFALKTVGVRRANDSKGAQPPEPPVESVALAPASWPGLGHLPDDVHIVAGVRVADALDSPAGRALLGPLGLANAQKTTILGISPGHVDNLMFGASLRALPPRVTAVVHGSIGDAPGPGRAIEQHGKTLHRAKLWATGPEGAIWRSDRHTLVAALLPEDFDHVPAKPRDSVPLSELMSRLDPQATAWLVASVDPNDAALVLAAPFLPAADRDAWTKLAALAVSLRADGNKITLNVHLRGRDAGGAIAGALAESLKKAAAEVTVTVPEAGDWYGVTATGDADKLAGWMRAK